MFLVTVDNAHTQKAEQYYCNRVTFGYNLLGFPMKGAHQVHLYCGIFDRPDSAIVIETFNPVRVLSEKHMDTLTLERGRVRVEY